MKIIFIILMPLIGFAMACWIYGKEKSNSDSFIVNDISVENYKILIKNAIKTFDGRDFEYFVANMFKFLGHKAYVTAATRDGGIDIVVDSIIGVECKCYRENNKVSSPIVLKLIGALSTKGLESGIIVTSSTFSNDAYSICPNDIELWDMDDIMNKCVKIQDYIGFLEVIGYDIVDLQRKGIVKAYKHMVTA